MMMLFVRLGFKNTNPQVCLQGGSQPVLPWLTIGLQTWLAGQIIGCSLDNVGEICFCKDWFQSNTVAIIVLECILCN